MIDEIFDSLNKPISSIEPKKDEASKDEVSKDIKNLYTWMGYDGQEGSFFINSDKGYGDSLVESARIHSPEPNRVEGVQSGYIIGLDSNGLRRAEQMVAEINANRSLPVTASLVQPQDPPESWIKAKNRRIGRRVSIPEDTRPPGFSDEDVEKLKRELKEIEIENVQDVRDRYVEALKNRVAEDLQKNIRESMINLKDQNT